MLLDWGALSCTRLTSSSLFVDYSAYFNTLIKTDCAFEDKSCDLIGVTFRWPEPWSCLLCLMHYLN